MLWRDALLQQPAIGLRRVDRIPDCEDVVVKPLRDRLVVRIGRAAREHEHAGDGAAALLHRAMEGGSAFIATLTSEQRALLTDRVDAIYRIVFLTIAAFTAIGVLLALRVPAMRWDDDATPTEE